MSHTLELLAPAGTIEVFETAVTSGADAVYVGAPMANARALAKHFSYEDIAAMVSFAHANGVKVYVAMNSLVKNDEFASVVRSLAIFEGIGIDALILQDLGIYAIARKYFPRLRLHASTLLGAYNSLAVKKLAEMGFARIVLAREMGIREIKEAGRVSPAEIEVFIHGAMCFSYSGLCLASSFLGGKSGLRGRCVQPCRRKYTWKGKHTGAPSGYFFSMNDLSGISMLEELQEAGVHSLKIEGRMRSLQYVQNVVKAYRVVIDNESSTDSLVEARDYLHQAMGRKTSTGFFSLPQQTDIISYQYSGNIGHFMGRISKIAGNKAVLKLQEDIKQGDRLRVHSEESGERQSFTVHQIMVDRQIVSAASKQTTIEIEVPETAKPQDGIYKVDTADSRMQASKPSQLKPQNFRGIIRKYKAGKHINRIVEELHQLTGTKLDNQLGRSRAPQRNKKKRPSRGRYLQPKAAGTTSRPDLPLWLKTDNFNKIKKLPKFHLFSRVIVLLTHETFSQFKKRGLFGLQKKTVIWALPPVIHEENLHFYREAITHLLSKDFRNWQLGHFSQAEFFDQHDRRQISDTTQSKRYQKNKRAFKLRTGHCIFHGSYTLNVLNTCALQEFARLGLKTAQIAMEADRQIVSAIAQDSTKIEKGLTVYAFPSLLTARASLDVFKSSAVLVSPKGEPFVLKELEDVTQVVSQRPFSLLSQLSELRDLGVDYGVVDISNAVAVRDQFGDILRLIAGKYKHGRLSSFNFNGTLW